MFLESFLTTIPRPDSPPEKVAELGFRVGTRVTIPYLDSRTCSGVTLDMHEDVVSDLFELDDDDVAIRDKTLALALKVYYRNRIVFHGPLSAPRYDFEKGQVELVAHDPSLRLKRAFLRDGDLAVSGGGITFDGEGMLTLLDSAQNTDAQDALNWPSLGIIRGRDTTSDMSDKLTELDRGDNIWQAMKDIADGLVNPDFNLVPIETDPAEIATGTDVWNDGAVVGDGVTIDVTLDVSRAGTIGDLELGIWLEHANAHDVRIDLVHPDGTTIRVYTGSKDDPTTAGTDLLGSGDTTGDLCFFKPGRGSIYAAGGGYPHVGTFRSDQSLSAFLGKPAAGTWTLRVHDVTTNTNTGFLDYFRLTFSVPAPAYCRMDVSNKPDTSNPDDLVPAATFHKGHGADNAKTLIVTPQGELACNQFIATSKHATRIPGDDESRAAYGTYQGYDSPGANHGSDFLLAWGQARVGAYSRPIPSLDLAPVDDSGTNDTVRFGEDFDIGDHVRAIGKRGNAYWSVLGRVTQVVLIQGQSAVETELEVVPAIAGGQTEDA